MTRARPHPETGSSRGQEEYGQWRAGRGNGERPDRAQALPEAGTKPPPACHLVDTGLGSTDKQGSPLLRWAVVEAIQRQPAGPIRDVRDRIIARRGKEARNIAKTAAARHLLTCVFYAMRDGQARSLARRTAARDAA